MRDNLDSTWCNACDDNYIISILVECQLPSTARQLFVMQHLVQSAGHHTTSGCGCILVAAAWCRASIPSKLKGACRIHSVTIGIAFCASVKSVD